MRKVVPTIAGFVLLVMSECMAQSYVEEALLISRIRSGGTARIQAMGGVQNALGGDISSAFYNPAGLGMYNRSEFSITPAYGINNFTSSNLGNSQSETKGTFIVPNIGVAFHSAKDGSKGIWGGTFAINFNRINDFNETFSYSGTNENNSIIDYFLYSADGADVSQFSSSGFNYNTPTGLGYFNFLIGPQNILNPPGPSNQYFTDVTGKPIQKEVVRNSGAQNQWSLSYGANIADKLFVGGGIGFTSIHYKSEKTYSETFDDPAQPMSQMELIEKLTLDGSGINATLGIIYRPVDKFQIGFSAATPTSYDINDVYNASMKSTWRSFEYQPGKILNSEEAATDDLMSTYSLITPWRLTWGMTYFFQKHGFISADAEWLNYGKTKYSGDDDYSGDNEDIRNLYKSVVNLRVGGEYRIKNYRLRAGYSLMPDPFSAQQNSVDRAISSISMGGGYKKSNYYVDLALIFGSGDNSYRPYSLNYEFDPLVTLKKKSTTIMITVGFPF